MANLNAKSEWSDVRQLEVTDQAHANVFNAQAQQLLNRIEFLKSDCAEKKELYAEITRATNAENSLRKDIAAGQGGAYSFTTIANFEVNKANVTANSKIEITSGNEAGSYNWDGIELTKSAYDPILQANQYTDTRIRELVGSYNIDFTISILTLVSAVSATTGELITSTNWSCSDFIEVAVGDILKLDSYSNSTSNANMVFYDKTKTFVSAISSTPINQNNTIEVTSPVDGYIRVASRTASSTQFSLNVSQINHILSSSDLDTTVASKELFLAHLENKGLILKAGVKTATISSIGFFDVTTGMVVSNTTSRYRKLTVEKDETVFYSGRWGTQSTAMIGKAPVVFVPKSNSIPKVIVPCATNLMTVTGSDPQYYSGEYTAEEPGDFYINLTTSFTSYGSVYLYSGVLNHNIYDFRDSTEEKIVSGLVVESDLYKRDLQAIQGNGDYLDITNNTEMIDNIVIHDNGGIQALEWNLNNTLARWATAYIPVRKDDVISYYGYILLSANYHVMYVGQLDSNKIFVEDLIPANNSGYPTTSGYTTLYAQAKQDGYICIRVYKQGVSSGSTLTYTIKRKSPERIQNTKSDSSEYSSESNLMILAEKLPIRLSMDHGYNSQTYTQNNLIEADGYTYIVGIDANRNPFVLQRKPMKNDWDYFDLSLISGNPFASPNAEDSHNNFVIVVTKDGYIIISGNHHANGCRAVISNQPHNIDAWTAIKYTTSTVTYPRLVRNGSKTLAFWRQGGSGDGIYYMSEFNDITRTFNEKRLLIGEATSVSTSNPYEQMIAIDASNVIHLCWGYRTTATSAVANFGMFYAKSADGGLTWTDSAASNSYTLPLTDNNSERIYTVELNQGYVNQNGGCVDLKGNYHTVFWHSDPDTGFSRIIHAWYNGTQWQNEIVHNLERTYPPTSNMLPGHYTRPHIICGQTGRVFVVFKNNYENPNRIVAIDVTDSNEHVEYTIVPFGTRQTELAINIDFPILQNELKMILAKGGGNVTNAIWKNQSAYLVTIPLPV